MTDRLLSPLSTEQRKIVRKEIVRFGHRLADTGLFTDEALAELIDLHPRERTMIRTLAPAGSPRDGWIAGAADGLSGAALLKAARQGRLWIRLDGVMLADPACRLVFDRMLEEFGDATGVMPLAADGSIVISSARLATPMSIDPAEACIWRLRGAGALYVYPAGPDAALPWTPARENAVTPVTLHPGQGAFPPVHSPHRIVNGEELTVSVVVEFETPRSRLTGLVRRALGRPSPAVAAEPDPTARFDVTARGLVWRAGQAPAWAEPAKPARRTARRKGGALKAA